MSETKKTGRGGKREGAGRPPLGNVYYTVRISPEEREKLKRLGGSAWLRKKIQSEPEPHQSAR